MDLKAGDIILTLFPFTSLTGSKRRPALVISKSDSVGDYIIAYISTSEYALSMPSGIRIEQSHPEWKSTGLKESSIIRTDKLATIHESVVSGRFGKLPSGVMKEVYYGIIARLTIELNAM